METVKLHPRVVSMVERGELRKDWAAIARQIRDEAPRWQLVALTKRTDRGIKDYVADKLAGVGCRAQVVALHGLGEAPRPWTGYAVFARIRGFETTHPDL